MKGPLLCKAGAFLFGQIMKRSPIKRKSPMRSVSKKRQTHRQSAAGQADLDHMRDVKQRPCCVCGAPGPSDAHHCIHDRYSAAKASDRHTIPLCKSCHQDGPLAIHNGKRAWRERNGPDWSYLPPDLQADYLK